MKFLADENFPKPLISAIQKLGFSVKSIQQKRLQGSSDQNVRRIAEKEKRIIITFDKDFLQDSEGLQIILFYFPKIATQLILEITKAEFKNLKMPRQRIVRFSRDGFEPIS